MRSVPPQAPYACRPADRAGASVRLSSSHPAKHRRPPDLPPDPQLCAVRMGPLVEDTVRAIVPLAPPIERLPEVAGPVNLLPLTGLLRVVAGPGQVPVEQRRRDPVREDGCDGAGTGPVLPAAGMGSGEVHRPGGDLR